jgi:hypothetical protein
MFQVGPLATYARGSLENIVASAAATARIAIRTRMLVLMLPDRRGDLSPNGLESEAAARNPIGSIELQQTLPTQMRNEAPTSVSSQKKDSTVAGSKHLLIGDPQRDAIERAPFDFNVYCRLQLPFECFADRHSDDRDNQAIAEFVDVPHWSHRRDLPDNDALCAACTLRQWNRSGILTACDRKGPEERNCQAAYRHCTSAHPLASLKNGAAAGERRRAHNLTVAKGWSLAFEGAWLRSRAQN